VRIGLSRRLGTECGFALWLLGLVECLEGEGGWYGAMWLEGWLGHGSCDRGLDGGGDRSVCLELRDGGWMLGLVGGRGRTVELFRCRIWLFACQVSLGRLVSGGDMRRT
jgi:hypothetical protein